MTATDARAKALEPFGPDETRTFQGRGGFQMTYVEDESVMDRLDIWPGPGNWQLHVEPFPYVEGVVKVRISIRPHDEWVDYEDFGYPNQDSGEQLKEAVSDGIRRVGRLIGIGRDLYRKRTYENKAPAAPQRPTAPARPQVVPDHPEDDEANPFDDPTSTAPIVRPEEVRCPHHPNREPRQNSRGYFCSGKDCPCANERGYCTWTAA